MTTRLLRLLSFTLVFSLARPGVAVGAGDAPPRADAASLEDNFSHPPDAARPWVFWFWSDGNVTREGITADLEAMKRVGIGGVVWMEVDQDVSKGPVRFMTPAWRNLMNFAVAEASRLGLKFDLNNDAGWTGSGGPWNDAEHSMQKVVWTERQVSGGSRVDLDLVQPAAVEGFYRDIAVLAFPTPRAETRTMQVAGVTASTSQAGVDAAAIIDGKSGTGVTLSGAKEAAPYVQLDFREPFEARSLTVTTGEGQHVICDLLISPDGTTFHDVVRAQSGPAGRTFERVRARHFRIVLNSASGPAVRVNEIVLSDEHRLERFAPKSGLGLIASPEDVAANDPMADIPREQILNLTDRVHDGHLTWDAPAGEWTVLRLGHTSTGVRNHPSPEEGTGLEVDKLSRSAMDRHYDSFVGKIIGGLPAATSAALDAVHIDSWEVGYQNWTADFAREFQRRRGYDPLPWLPTLTGRIVGSEALTERFLWDVRRTISELVVDNYATRMAERAHADHRQFTLEGYRYGPFDCLSVTRAADIPVGEFWVSPDPEALHPSVKTMASAGHIYGKPVIAAESFTATDVVGRQRNHPYTLKAIGDAAFCAGINQFVIHRYSMQPWVDDRKPGMTMGPWGVEYERTATWWEQTKPWHEYLARCQYLLRQGTFVADLCYLQSEEGFNNPAMPVDIEPAVPAGYDYDLCSDDVVRTRMVVADGRLRLPDGMSYRVLVLPSQRLMTVPLLRRIRDLVRDGAIVYGPPPWHPPGLTGYPESDAEFATLVDQLWEKCDCDGRVKLERSLGHGKVVWGCSLEDLLHAIDLERDFAWRPATATGAAAMSASDASAPSAAPIHSIHRSLADRDVYFVANLGTTPAAIVASFRVANGTPELWDAETGSRQPAIVSAREKDRIRLPLTLGPRGSVFVVFRRTAGAPPPAIAIKRDGRPWQESGPVETSATTPPAVAQPTIADTFTMAAWVKPAADTALPKEDVAGTAAYSVARNDILFPPPVHELLGRLDVAGAGFAVGRNGVTVVEHGDHHFPATLVYRAPISEWTHLAVVYDRGVPSLYVNGERVRTGLKTALKVYCGVGVRHSRLTQPFLGQHSAVERFDRALDAAAIRRLMHDTPAEAEKTTAAPTTATAGLPRAPLLFDRWPTVWAAERGRYEFEDGGGKSRTLEIGAVPENVRVDGPWTLHFPPGWGAPSDVPWPALISWTQHPDAGVRYFSGTARYETTFTLDAVAQRRLWLDLGDVREIAEVAVNGRPVGTLWKPPYRIEVTDAVHAGENRLEIKVTNLWINRLIGDEQLPLDREWRTVPRRGGFALKRYPDWFQHGERSPTGRVTVTTWKHYEKDAPLVPSGLLGPVVIESAVSAEPSPSATR